MKKNILLLLIFILPVVSFAQSDNDTVFIQTSAQCGTCKKKIEHEMAFVKGVKTLNLDVKSRQLMVVYNPKKINTEGLRQTLSKIGYDADSVAADPKAYMKLPECCKKGGHD